MTDLHTPRRPCRASYRSFLSNLSVLLRENSIRTRSEPPLPVAGASTEQTAARDPVVGQVQTFVDEHLAADLTVDRLAEVADTSPSSLVRRFRAERDTTPWQYVVERRIEKAKRLLAETNRSIAAIAIDTGFYDQAHLTRTFRRLDGRTPGTFREESD